MTGFCVQEAWPCEGRKILRARRRRERGRILPTVSRTPLEKVARLCQYHQECGQPLKDRPATAKAGQTVARTSLDKVIILL